MDSLLPIDHNIAGISAAPAKTASSPQPELELASEAGLDASDGVSPQVEIGDAGKTSTLLNAIDIESSARRLDDETLPSLLPKLQQLIGIPLDPEDVEQQDRAAHLAMCISHVVPRMRPVLFGKMLSANTLQGRYIKTSRVGGCLGGACSGVGTTRCGLCDTL